MRCFFIFILALPVLVLPSAKGQSTSPDSVIFRTAPPVFEQQEEMKALRERLQEVTRLHLPEVDEAKIKALETEARTLLKKMDTLQKQERTWQKYQTSLQQGQTTQSAPFDWPGLFELWHQYDALIQKDMDSFTHKSLFAPDKPTATVKEWLALSRDLDRFQNVRFSLNNVDPTRFLLNTFYLQGMCYFNAANVCWKEEDNKNHLVYYEKALRIHQRTLEIIHLLNKRGTLAQVEELPKDWKAWVDKNNLSQKLSLQQKTALSKRCLSLNQFSANMLYILEHYCPWGVHAYFALKDMEVLSNVDFNILRGFYNPFFLEYPPKLCVRTLPENQVPFHVLQDMRTITGDNQTMAGQIIFQNGQTTPVQWQALTKPAYSLWILGPSIYDLKPSEIASAIDTIRDVVFAFDPSEKLYGAGGYALDLTVKGIAWGSQKLFGNDSKIYGVASKGKILYEAGIDKDLIFDYAEKGFNWSKLLSSIATEAFQYMDEQELEMLFEGIDPNKANVGHHKGYRHTPIPPIILRAEVFGFVKTLPHEYLRSHRVIRYYLLDYGKLSGLDELYQLNDFMSAQVEPMQQAHEYVAGNHQVIRQTWPLMPKKGKRSFGVRDHQVNFTPKAQALCLRINPELYKAWLKEAKTSTGQPTLPEVRFYDTQEMNKPAAERHDFIRTDLEQPNLICQFVHRPYFPATHPDYVKGWPENSLNSSNALGESLRQLAPNPNLSNQQQSNDSSGVLGSTDTNPATPKVITNTLREGALSRTNLGNLAWRWENACLYRSLERAYLAEVRIGDQIKAEIPLVFATTDKQRIIGKLSWPANHFCLLDQAYPETRNKPIPLKPNYAKMLPPRIMITSATSLYGKTEYHKNGKYGVAHLSTPLGKWDMYATLTGTLSGIPLKKGYHRVTVSIADRKFYMWAHVRHAAMPAHIECEIAVPPGNHEVIVTCPNVRPYRFTISRPESPNTSKDLIGAEKSYQQSLQRYRQERTQDQAESLSISSTRLAEQLQKLQRHEEAYKYFEKAKKLCPDWNSHGWYIYADLRNFSDACFYMGDPNNLIWAGQAAIERDQSKRAREAYKKFGRGHKEVARLAQDAAREYENLIRRFVSLGGSADIANQLNQKMLFFWSMAGFNTEEFRFTYGQQLGLSFGPSPKGSLP